MEIKIDCGGGYSPKPGYLSCDRQGYVDIAADFTYHLPFKDNTIHEIWCSHTLEHLPGLSLFLNECWRILSPGCRMKITVPRAPHESAFSCPTHLRFFVPSTFLLFTNDFWCNFNGYKRWGIVISTMNDTDSEVYREMIPLKGEVIEKVLTQEGGHKYVPVFDPGNDR
jgi:SAM-dependent methyltransferase